MNNTPKREPQLPQPAPQKSAQQVVSQSVKTEAQEIKFAPDKNVVVPEFICLANERQEEE